MNANSIVINGVKCLKKGVRFNGEYTPVYYSRANLIALGDAVTIYARGCKSLPKQLGEVKNDSDAMTDYFESDLVRFLVGTPEYNSLLPLCQ